MIVVLFIILVILYIFNEKKKNKTGTIELFNTYSMRYLLNIIHSKFVENDIWYVLTGDILNDVIHHTPLSNNSILYIYKDQEEKYLSLIQKMAHYDLVFDSNMEYYSISPEYNRNINVIIYLVSNNNGMLEICSTKLNTECNTKCCKVNNSSTDFDKMALHYGDTNPRKLYNCHGDKFYGPNKPNVELHKECPIVSNKSRDKLTLQRYISNYSKNVEPVIYNKNNINIRGIYKFLPLNNVMGYNKGNYYP